jgi:hypothetical protein
MRSSRPFMSGATRGKRIWSTTANTRYDDPLNPSKISRCATPTDLRRLASSPPSAVAATPTIIRPPES